MAELTKEDVKEAVREAMAEKFELTFGVDCQAPEERQKLRDDMAFIRAMREAAVTGGKRVVWWMLGVSGTAGLALLWPEISKHIQK